MTILPRPRCRDLEPNSGELDTRVHRLERRAGEHLVVRLLEILRARELLAHHRSTVTSPAHLHVLESNRFGPVTPPSP